MNNISLIPAEQTDKRNEYSKTYAVGPGMFAAFASPVPLHMFKDNTWLPCDARFMPDNYVPSEEELWGE